MSNQYITINGTSFNPTSIEYSIEKVGESRRMADGTLRYYHRANKYKWTLQWASVRESRVSAIQTVGELTTSTTFIDYEGVSHTVILLPGCFKKTLSADKVASLTARYFDVELVLDEV